MKVTFTSVSVVENGTELAVAVEDARFVPKIETSDPGATGCPLMKLAELSDARLGSIAGVCADATIAPPVDKTATSESD